MYHMTNMTKDLTPKQLAALQALERFISENGMSPTFFELQALLGVSSNQAVINYLNILEGKGYIERKKTARGIIVRKSINDEGSPDLLELLAETRASKKDKQTIKEPSSVPVSLAEESGAILGVSFNNEQF